MRTLWFSEIETLCIMGNYLTLQVETWSVAVMLPNTKRWDEDDMQQVQFVVREGRKEGRKEGSVLAAGRRLPVWLIVCPFTPTWHQHGTTRWAACSRWVQVSSGEFVLSVLALKDSSSSDSDPCPWRGSHQVTSRQNKASHHQDRCDWWWWCSWSIYRCFRSAVN